MSIKGTLFIVSTPIGNLEDITYRAVRILGEAGLIAAEDTRVTSVLLKHYGIRNKVVSFHSHNQHSRTKEIIEDLESGTVVALVSDAGTPGISDPAYTLITSAIEHGIPVVPIPGPTALATALVGSGLPADKFVFEGFLPRRKGKKTKRLESLAATGRTIILYESPYRIAQTLKEVASLMGNRNCTVCRELTKKFEEFRRGTALELAEYYTAHQPKGEITLVIAPPADTDNGDVDIEPDDNPMEDILDRR